LSLLRQSEHRRDRVALATFGGAGVRLLLPAARGGARLSAALEALPVGGGTPLAHGLAFVRRLVEARRRREPRLPVYAAVFTDGRANVPFRASGGDSWGDALLQARALALSGVDGLVVDTDAAWPHLGRAQELACALGVPYRPLEEVVSPLVRSRGRPA
jgi:magnesium chelatase subunit D